jgi:hypothetical protein
MNPELKDLLALAQRGLANVGVYISLSLALLGYSRFYRGKGDMYYNLAFIVISITMMLLALKVLNTLLEHLHKFKAKLNEEDLKLLNEFIVIPRGLFYILISISFFSFFTLYRELKQ